MTEELVIQKVDPQNFEAFFLGLIDNLAEFEELVAPDFEAKERLGVTAQVRSQSLKLISGKSGSHE
jgi:hypothetical protein